MALTSYSDLKSAVSNWLARSDLTSVVGDFISLAEAKLKRDPRILVVQERNFTLSTETYALPSDFKSAIALYGNSSSLRGPIEIVPAEKLAETVALYGATGAPMVAASFGGYLNFAPAPQQSYAMKLIYEATVAPLSDTATSNWLLTNHPDVYLYSALLEAAPYLKDDARIAVWQGLREQAIAEVVTASERKRFGGRMVIRPRQTIG